MVGVIYVYFATVFGFMGGGGGVVCLLFYCIVGCFSMIVWTPVMSVLYACVLYLPLFSAIERRSRNNNKSNLYSAIRH